MKNRFLFIALAFGVLSQSGFSAGRSTAATGGFYLGFAADSFSTGTTNPGLSALITMGEKTALQMYLSMAGISPFQIGGGANLKYSVAGNVEKGIHIGGGVGLGAKGTVTSNFFVNVAAITGIHFELVENVLINLDGGLALAITTPGSVDLTLTTLSPNFGASILLKL